ncbi:MoaF C-terminal domain-containing protein [Myceligenerans pegani]|uniref:MoaF N-terminal domain-containing protein n=1 Tax=Myceligenerans pegani TaxID=2776917 RepID=A0ABR9MWR9_9MICO|nr:MoaF C-terminal domain-containing protein [Myceligenerans sp. TRM 65318]MBE1875832.1 MoaF N-terminal domain-containing protein [Myceligenerans sp. TRM 65318]MBE3018103.1 MoaF N-terminal domain-containing protein [Myceligenerans sp. TRM 65318]
MTESFIPVGALGDGFAPDANLLEPVADLDDLPFELDLGERLTLTIDGGVARWGGHSDVPVRVTSVRDGVYLIDGVAGGVSTTFVLDTEAGLVTLVEGELPPDAVRAESAWTRVQRGDDPTGVTARIRHGRVAGSTAPVHAPTTELVGFRNRYTYSPHERYEHIYLTPDRYTWHCLTGVEQGLADTDRCHHIRIRDGLTLFVWREKIVPTLGLLLIDLSAMRTDGKIFGNTGFDTTSTVNFPVGARAEVLDTTGVR